MKMKLLLPLFLLLSLTMFGQSLTLGAVVFSVPEAGAREFTLISGLYQKQAQDQAQFNGFHYGNGTFPLWNNGGPGLCLTGSDPNVPGCRFDGTIGTLQLYSTRIALKSAFPLPTASYRFSLAGVNDRKNVTALYSRTFLQCSRQPLHGRWDPGSLFAVKKRNREFGITSHFRFWLGARSISPWAGAPYAQPGGFRSRAPRSQPARFAPAS
jgi:hypothetical protein